MTRRLLVAAGLVAVTACITRTASHLLDRRDEKREPGSCWGGCSCNVLNDDTDLDEPCCATPDQVTP